MRQAAFGARSSTQQKPARGGNAGGLRRATRVVVVCSSAQQREDGVSRRQAILSVGAGAALLGATGPLAVATPAAQAGIVYVPVEGLGAFQKKDQLAVYQARAEKLLKEVVTAADAPAALRLVLHDAGTYDVATKKGGFDGSVVLSEELGRPENADLAPLVERLAQAKAKIDEAAVADGSGPISWADLLVLAAKISTQLGWKAIKLGKAVTSGGGDVLSSAAFGAAWPVRLGRVDSGVPGPAGKIPQADAPVAEVKAYLLSLGAKPGQTGGLFGVQPPFWERPGFVIWTAAAADPAAEEARFVAADPAFKGVKESYDRSRRTVTRTDYEVDFVDYFTVLTNLGATFSKTAYLKPEPVQALQ